MQWTNMMSVLSNYNSKTILTIYLPNGVIVDGFVDTVSETCTCELDENDPNYQEYYMCVMKITDIVQLPEQGAFNEKVGDFIEISIMNEPIKIVERGKGVIWQK